MPAAISGVAMKQSMHRIVSLVLLAMLMAACSDQPGKQWAAKKRARAAARKLQDQAEELPPVPPGEKIFAENCLICHKVRNKGGVVGPDLSKIGQSRDGDYLEQVIRQPAKVYPGSVMPPFEHLPSEQIDALVDYLLTLK